MRNFNYTLKILLISTLGLVHANDYIFKDAYAELNGDHNKEFIYTQMLNSGILKVQIRMGDWIYRKNIDYQLWSLRTEEFDSIIVKDNSNIIYYYGGGFIEYSNISFIRPVKSINKDVMVINVHWWSGAVDGGEGYGVIVIYWDNQNSDLKKLDIVVEGELKQSFYPRWTLTYYKFLGWYSFLAHAEQPAIRICKVWDWDPPGFKTNARRYLTDYLKMLKKLKIYLIKAKSLGNKEDIQRIKEDIKTVIDLIHDSLHK